MTLPLHLPRLGMEGAGISRDRLDRSHDQELALTGPLERP